MSFAAAFGRVLRRHREAKGLTQQELAEAADLHLNYVSLLERGLRSPSLEVTIRLARGLGEEGASGLVAETEAEVGDG